MNTKLTVDMQMRNYKAREEPGDINICVNEAAISQSSGP